MLDVGEGEGRLGALALGLLGLLVGAEGLGVGAIESVLVLEMLDLGLEDLVLVAGLPCRGELVRGTGGPAFESASDNAFLRTGHTGQEVGGCGARGTLEAEVDEVLPGLGGLAKEDLATLVKHGSLVEEIVGRLRSLVDRHAGGVVEELSLEAEGPAELNGVGAVKTSSTVVPALQGSTGQGSLGNGHTLPLASGNSTDVLVTHSSVDGVGNTEHGHDDVSEVVCEHGLRNALGESPGLTRMGGKGKGVTDGELGEVLRGNLS